MKFWDYLEPFVYVVITMIVLSFLCQLVVNIVGI
jgi:hypothetical protein